MIRYFNASVYEYKALGWSNVMMKSLESPFLTMSWLPEFQQLNYSLVTQMKKRFQTSLWFKLMLRLDLIVEKISTRENGCSKFSRNHYLNETLILEFPTYTLSSVFFGPCLVPTTGDQRNGVGDQSLGTKPGPKIFSRRDQAGTKDFHLSKF